LPQVGPAPRLAVTLGDPAGIGPEVVARALLESPAPEDAWRPVVIGPLAALAEAARALGGAIPLHPVRPDHDPWRAAPAGTVPAIDTSRGFPLPEPGAPGPDSGRMAVEALDTACALAASGRAEGVVTAPLSKDAVRRSGRDGFVGQTEYLAQRTGTPEVRMMMAGGSLRVVLVTTHVALRELPGRIDTEGVLATIRLTHAALRRHEGIAAPRIAVCGLNPHPGEFGDEDGAFIAPAVERARDAGIDATGPLAADGLFGQIGRLGTGPGGYDAVVAMYHDQGLIPVKLLAPDGAVNVTLGLPFVRTAPGHGTAFDIAGRGLARGEAMRAALALAARWAAALPGTARAG
jgi:4-hydroxythreonine-4-phosphate dehydrogenase